ncbi:MAG: DUF4276 family protein [Methylobacteriaceae bacterium]|jgi:hypothetical protein|nr:DUF4276 family protein [Methylobacteriaceae bacterium]
MHFEILVEDQSGKKALEILVPGIIGDGHTFRIIPYKGIGRIPKGMTAGEPEKRILLDQLPRLLRGYGETFPENSTDYRTAVVVVCDLDDKCLKTFRQKLLDILNACTPKPETRFCFAVEEGEAWFLGDPAAVKAAYPKAKDAVLNAYRNDSICGTWELLADAVFPGGVRKLAAGGYQSVGAEKSRWAEKIAPHMDVNTNRSPSFIHFRDKLRELAAAGA